MMGVKMNDEVSEGQADNSVSDPHEFCASEKQLAYLTACQDVDYAISVTDACAAAGVGRRSYYDWLDNSDFNRWWLLRLERHFMDRLPAIYSTLFEIAQKGVRVGTSAGQVAAAKLLLERFDKLYRPKVAHDPSAPEGIEQYLKRVAREQLEAEGALSGQNPVDRPGPPEPSVEPGQAPSAPATSP